ncbi:MAG: EAL domain-containing protein [Nitrospirota bacterium]
MKKRTKKSGGPAGTPGLRQRAEERLRQQTALLRELSKQDIERLVHELGTHQIELEMQNEELRAAQEEIEESRRKYADLYDFAPVGYLTLDRDGMILEANHTAGILLEKPKRTLRGRRLSMNIVAQDHARFRSHIDAVFTQLTRQACELRLRSTEQGEFPVRLESIAALDLGDHPVHMRTALIDITERVRAEQSLKESEERFRILADSAPVLIWVNGLEGAEFVNRAYIEFVGVSREVEVRRYDWAKFVHPEDRERYVAAYLDCFARRAPFEAQFRFRRADGVYRWMKSTGRPRFTPEGRFLGYVGSTVDITDIKEAEAEREEVLRRERAARQEAEEGRRILDALLEFIPEGIAIADAPHVTLRMISRYGQEIIGPIAGARPEEWRVMRPDGAAPASPEELPLFRAIRRGAVIINEEWTVRKPDGSTLMLLCNAGPIRDGQGRIVKGVIAWREITERKQMEDAIRYQASHDLLTGLPNRTLFMDRLNHEIAQARRHHTLLAVMFLDIDRFKTINDSLGHGVGDELLKQVAERLRSAVRESDTVSRIGGDEFTILLTDIVYSDDAAAIAKKVMASFRKPFSFGSHDFSVSASVGIGVFPQDGEYADELLKNADIAMYHAKEQGRNNYQFYSPALNIRTIERMILENGLRRTLERGELTVYYQPQMHIATCQVGCAEALVRWKHPELGLLGPEQFIPLAEEIGFIVPIDEWVLYTVCRQNRQWQDEGAPPLCVTVNLSARQFQHPGLVDLVSRILRETSLGAQYLGIEITETIAMQETAITMDNLKGLSSLGVKCSIDDFGTGYSSLSYLKRLPIAKLKIDKSFIKGLTGDPDDQAIVNAVIGMSHSMHIAVVAEGVETEAQVAYLRSAGCDELQGFVVSEALPAEEFMKVAALYR